MGKRVFTPERDARVTIYDEEGNFASYEQLSARHGIYCLRPDEIEIRVGKSYHVTIETSDGRSYLSKPEMIMPVPQIDSIYFVTSLENSLVDETRLLEKRYFDLYITTTLDSEKSSHLKWDVEFVYLFPAVCNGRGELCYVNDKRNKDQIQILDGNRIHAGKTFKKMIFRRQIDFAFSNIASFFVSQKSLTSESFHYWQNIEKVVSNVGSIFDAPPSAVPGNFDCTSDPDEPVLGFFSAYDERRELLFVQYDHLPAEDRKGPLCGTLQFPVQNPQLACCDCLRHLEGSSMQRPKYWP